MHTPVTMAVSTVNMTSVTGSLRETHRINSNPSNTTLTTVSSSTRRSHKMDERRHRTTEKMTAHATLATTTDQHATRIVLLVLRYWLMTSAQFAGGMSGTNDDDETLILGIVLCTLSNRGFGCCRHNFIAIAFAAAAAFAARIMLITRPP